MSSWLPQTVLGVASLLVALFALRTSIRALRNTYRPVLRPVPLRAGGDTNSDIHPLRLVLKNIGRGPAVSVVLLSPKNKVMVRCDLVQPLGESDTPERAPGRVLMELDQAIWLEDGMRCRLLYRDIANKWHETTLHATHKDFIVRFLGPRHWWRIPAAAKERGDRVRAEAAM